MGSIDAVVSIPYKESIKNLTFSYGADSGEGPMILRNLSISGIDEAYYDKYRDDVEARKESRVDIVQFEGDRIKLNADIRETEEYLFASVPYDERWKAYIDGNPVKIIKANLTFMAVPITQGKHTVEWVYK